MRVPSFSRLGRLKGIRTLYCFLLVAPPRRSMRLLGVVGREIDDMIAEWEVELELEALVIAKRASLHTRSTSGSVPAFDDGDHLVEDQMPELQRDHSTGSTK